MAIDIRFPSYICKRCGECVLDVVDRNGTTIVSCKKQSNCPYVLGKATEENEREENKND